MLDQIIIFTYLILLLFVGLYTRSKALDIKSYGKIDSSIQSSVLFLLTAIFTNSVGGGTVIGLSEKTVSGNLAYVYAMMLTILVDITIAIFLLPRIAKHYGVVSIGEIVEKHYGQFGRIMSGISASLVSFGYIAVQISASSKIFQYLLHVNYAEGVVLSYLIVITYTAIGGLRSIIFTDFVQFIAIMLCIPIIAFVGLYKLGINEFINALPAAKYSLPLMWQEVVLLFLSFSFMGFYPGFIQRSFMTKDYRYTQRAIFRKSFIYFIFLIFIAINGLLAYIYEHDGASSLALLNLIDHIMPTGLKGIAIVGLIAAVTSTADSELNVASLNITNDVIQPIFKVKNNKIVLLFTQLAAFAVGILAIYLALQFDNVIDLLLFIAGFWLPVMLIPFIACLYNITVSKIGLVFCAIAGITTFSYWQEYCAEVCMIKSAFVGLVANLICFIIVRLVESFKR